MKICAIGLRGIPDVMGGIETHCEHLYPRLAELDNQIEIIVIGRSGYARTGQFADIRVISLWAPKMKALETLIHTPLAILYARLFLHPAVIHLHAVGPGFFAPLARLLGFRVVATHHAADYKRAKWGRLGRAFLRSGEWMIAKFANDVVCVSGELNARLSASFPGRREHFITIHNGAPKPGGNATPAPALLESLGVKPGGYVLGVGRLDPAKGFHDLVAAFRIAKPEGMKLIIAGGSIGSDAYAMELMQSASEDIIFAGARSASDLRTLYSNAGLFVHASYLEGYAIVVLEALAADAPVIVSDIAPHIEVGLASSSYFGCGDVTGLAKQLSDVRYDRFRCTRREEILQENDWDTAARRHRDLLVSQVRGRPAEAPSPVS